MKRFTALLVFFVFSVALAASPAQLAETVRSSLATAQLELMLSPASARAPLQKAEAAYAKLGLAALEPALHTRAETALVRAKRAVKRGDEAGFADLQGALTTRDAAATTRAAKLFTGLSQTLDAASRHTAVVPPDAVKARVQTLTETLQGVMPAA